MDSSGLVWDQGGIYLFNFNKNEEWRNYYSGVIYIRNWVVHVKLTPLCLSSGLCEDPDKVILTFSNEDEKEEESSEEEDEDKRRLNDELLGKVVSVASTSEKTDWYPALVSHISLQN